MESMPTQFDHTEEVFSQELLLDAAQYFRVSPEEMDPFLVKWIEWFAKRLAHDKRSFNAKLDEATRYLAQRLRPDRNEFPGPGFAILKAGVQKNAKVVVPGTVFELEGAALPAPVGFTSEGRFQLLPVEVCGLLNRGKFWKAQNQYLGKWVAEYTLPQDTPETDLWIALSCSEDLSQMNGLTFFFDWPDLPAFQKEWQLRVLADASWEFNEKKINCRALGAVAERSEFSKEVDPADVTGYEPLARTASNLLKIWGNHFFQCTNIERATHASTDPIVASSTPHGDVGDIKGITSGKLLWLHIRSPLPFPDLQHHQMVCQTNCFPVWQRRLLTKTINTDKWLNVFQLEVSPFSEFQEVHKITSDQGSYRSTDEHIFLPTFADKAIPKGSFFVQKKTPEKIEGLNTATIKDWITERLRAGASDITMDTDELELLQKTIQLLKQDDDQRNPSVYLNLLPYQSEEIIHVEYWVGAKPAELSTLLPGSRFMGPREIFEEGDAIQLFNEVCTPQSRNADTSLLLSAGLLNGNRKPTTSGLKSMCRYLFGEEIARLAIEVVAYPVWDTTYYGLKPVILIKLFPADPVQKQPATWFALGRALENQLQEYFISTYLFRVWVVLNPNPNK